MHTNTDKYNSQNKNLTLDFIRGVLENDFYYQPSKYGGLREISEEAEKIIDKIFLHNKSNPIITSWGDRVYFDPDEDNVERDGKIVALIKYAVHFVTSQNQVTGFRSFDRSKVEYIDKFFDIIYNANWKLTVKSDYGDLSYNFLWTTEKNSTHILVGRIDKEDKKCCRIVGFLPAVKDKRRDKKIASALKAEAKTTRVAKLSSLLVFLKRYFRKQSSLGHRKVTK